MSFNATSPETPSPEADIPAHRATYSRDKETGEVLVRLVGPDAWNAEGATIPVTTKKGDVHEETLTNLVFSGTDDWQGPGYQPSYGRLGIYRVKPKPRAPREPGPRKPFVF